MRHMRRLGIHNRLRVLNTHPNWIPLLLNDWRGYCCLVLADDSPASELLNNFIERHWWHLHAQSGNDLLILVMAKAPPNWRDDYVQHIPKGRLRNAVRKNLQLLSTDAGVSKARSCVAAFLRDLDVPNDGKTKLPALAFFRWTDADASAAKRKRTNSTRIWEQYPSLTNVLLMPFPHQNDLAAIDRVFGAVFHHVREAGSDFTAFEKRITRLGTVLKAKATAGSLFIMLERLLPFVNL